MKIQEFVDFYISAFHVSFNVFISTDNNYGNMNDAQKNLNSHLNEQNKEKTRN